MKLVTVFYSILMIIHHELGLIDLFRPRLIVSSKVFQDPHLHFEIMNWHITVHLIYHILTYER